MNTSSLYECIRKQSIGRIKRNDLLRRSRFVAVSRQTFERQAFAGYFPPKKPIRSPSAGDKLWPRLKDHLKQLLHVKQQRNQEPIITKEKLESALHYSLFANRILQDLADPNGLIFSQSSTNEDYLATTLTCILETELQCGICTEVIIEAMTLECSHMFCSLCITEWSKMKDECPICRQPVMMFTKTLALDGFIDKVLDLLSPELKTQRLEMIAERNLASGTVERGADVGSYFPSAAYGSSYY